MLTLWHPPTDYDECAQGDHDCWPGTSCRNTLGSFFCTCGPSTPHGPVEHYGRPCEGEASPTAAPTTALHRYKPQLPEQTTSVLRASPRVLCLCVCLVSPHVRLVSIFSYVAPIPGRLPLVQLSSPPELGDPSAAPTPASSHLQVPLLPTPPGPTPLHRALWEDPELHPCPAWPHG